MHTFLCPQDSATGMDLAWEPSQVRVVGCVGGGLHAHSPPSLSDFRGQGQSMRRKVGQVLRNPGFLLDCEVGADWGPLPLVHLALCPLFTLPFAPGPPAQNGHGAGTGGDEGIGVRARAGVLRNFQFLT